MRFSPLYCYFFIKKKKTWDKLADGRVTSSYYQSRTNSWVCMYVPAQVCVVCFVCMCYTWVPVCALFYACCGSCSKSCYICCMSYFCLCASRVWLCYMRTWCVCGCEYVDIITLDQNSKLPILNCLPKKQLPYCILVSDIIFNLFSLSSILFTFLRISTEMWQRINLFIQTALNQSVPLTGSLFFIDFKFKRCSEAEQCTSTNIADFTEGGQERQRCVFQSWG